MSLTEWLRGLFRSDPEKRAVAQLSREERRRARLGVQAAQAKAGARHQFKPPTPPSGF